MSKYSLLFLFFCVYVTVQGQPINLDLLEVIRMAKNQSPSAKAAETRKENFYWRYRNFRADYNPSLNLSGNIPGYYQGFSSITQPDGSIVYRRQEQINSSLNLGLVQPLAFSGGQVSVNSSLGQVNSFREDITQWNSVWYYIQINQPIFGFNSLKWDKRTEPLRYEESRRSFVEEMEAISQEVTNRFFDYLDAQINLQIAEFNLANNDTIYHIEEGRYNIGTTSKDKLLQVELQLLRSQQDVAQAKLDLQTTRLALTSYIGLQDSSALSLELPEVLPVFEIPIDKALSYAKMNRSDYIAFERRRIEAERDLTQAKLSRFQTNLTASFGLNNAGNTIDESYMDPNRQQRIDVSLNVPILDWGRAQSRVKTAMANKKLTQYTIDQEVQNFEQEIITQVSRFEMLRKQIEITRKSDEVAQERYEVAQNRYLIGKIDITNLNIALTEKDNARRSYINALRSFWTSYFNLRRLTLYDFANDELLYQIED